MAPQLDDFETSALRRYEDEKDAKVETRGLLPIKTKRGGIIPREAEVVGGGDSESESSESPGSPKMAEAADEDRRGAEVTVLSLVSQREAALRAFKVLKITCTSNDPRS